VLFILGPAAGIITPLNSIFQKKIVLNHGGLNEWERKKFSWIERLYLRISHEIAAHWATYNIADNNLLRESILEKFKEDSIVIRYGGDHVMKVAVNDQYIQKYPFIKEKYAVSVSRAQEDNNLHVILEAFESIDNFKIVLISNWQVSKYGRDLKEKYSNYDNMILLDAIYDSYELNMLRSNAALYIHSHSQCGTAPSLVEAICLGLPIISFDVPTNRETTKNKVLYFENEIELKNHLISLSDVKLDHMKNALLSLIQKEYTWKYIASQYRELFLN
jgi:glycosyltransferase involved in cell wall biosynthesis